MTEPLGLGIHHQRYLGGVGAKNQYPRLTTADIVSLDKRCQDIACLDTTFPKKQTRVWLACLPGAEDLSGGNDPSAISPTGKYRIWGFHHTDFALVLPIQINAGHSSDSPDVLIRNYQVDVVLQEIDKTRNSRDAEHGQYENDLNGSEWEKMEIQISGSKPQADGQALSREDSGKCIGQQASFDPRLCLLDVPRPQQLEKHYPALGWWPSVKRWKFCSRLIFGSPLSQSCTASMMWSAENHPPETVHCALAIGHPNETFGISCRVSGKAYVGGYPYYFNNSRDEQRIWQLQPRHTLHDLQKCIDTLEERMIQMNRGILSTEPVKVQQAEDTHRRRVYTALHVHGGSVIAGDVAGDYVNAWPELGSKEPLHAPADLEPEKEDFS